MHVRSFSTTNALRQLSVKIAYPQKIFYYDCVDERQGGNESDEESARRVKAQVDRFNAMPAIFAGPA